jgi:hypothetical protein
MSEAGKIRPPTSESEDARPRVVGVTAGALALITALSVAVGYLVAADGGAARAERRPVEPSHLFQDGPGQRTSVEDSWRALDKASAASDGYGWIDRDRGIVRIPLSRAIDLICAEQGTDGRRVSQPASPHD